MQALQSQGFLSSDATAMDDLQAFLHRRRQTPQSAENFDQIEQEHHRLFVAAEREALGHELSRFDRDVPQIEIDGERYLHRDKADGYTNIDRHPHLPILGCTHAFDGLLLADTPIGIKRLVHVHVHYLLNRIKDRRPCPKRQAHHCITLFGLI
jgi:hypothetical protein